MNILNLLRGLPLALLMCSGSAFAATLNVPIQAAAGTTNSPPVQIQVPRGHSINLNFLPTGQQVQTVWLDDPSKVVLSFDTPLCQSPFGIAVTAEHATQTNCGNASIIHLRQLAQPIAFDPNQKTSFRSDGGEKTLLSVVATQGQQRFLYEFMLQLTPTNEAPYTTVNLMPNPPSRPPILAASDQQYVQKIEQGLQHAQSQERIDATSPEWAKLQNFIQLVKSGNWSVRDAVYQSGVSEALLGELGRLATFPEPGG
ncbi:MAG: hypothetical protein AAGF24_04055 [Cyanobacteria bacterium P01_H01_bin.121]